VDKLILIVGNPLAQQGSVVMNQWVNIVCCNGQ